MSASVADPDELEPTALVPATPRELKGLVRDWRRGRATKSLWDAFSDAYVIVIGVLMLGAMLVNVVLRAQRTVAQCDTETCLSARTVLPWAAYAAVVALTLTVSRLFGPVLASTAEGFWLLDAPVARARLLGPRLLGGLAAAFGLGAALGAVVAALSGSGGTAVAVWAAASGASAAGAVAFAAAQQGIERHRLLRGATVAFGTVAVGALVAVVGVAAAWFDLGATTDAGVELGLVLLGFGLAVLVVAGVLARLRLGRIRRARLTSGGGLVSGISGAFYALDIGLMRDIVVARRCTERGHVRPRPGRGLGLSALVWRDAQRLARSPQPLLVLAGTVVIPYACDALGAATLTPVLAALSLFVATIPLLGGLRVLTRSRGLARALPFTTAQLKLAAVAVPAGVAGLWVLATAPAYTGFGEGAAARDPAEALLVAAITGVAGLLAAVRWTQAKGVDFGAPMVSTAAGAFPPGLVGNLFRGFDVALVVTAPLLLGFSPYWSIVLAGIVALLLFNSFDPETARAQQAEQRRQLERRRAAAEAARRR